MNPTETKNLNARIALDIVIDLEREWPYLRRFNLDWDSDKARQIIEMRLPLTTAEAEAQMDEVMKAESIPVPKEPSLIVQLRTALGLAEGASIRTILTTAIAVLKKDCLGDSPIR